jgi:hypothetical protein
MVNVEPISFSIGAIVAALAAHFWRRYRGRMALISWQLTNQWAGGSREHAVFGKVEVYHQGRMIPNLTFSTVTLRNESARDLKDVVINLTAGDGFSMFASSGAVRGSTNTLPFTKEFEASVTKAASLPADDASRAALIAHIQHRRDYVIPVWNRDAIVDIRCLGETPIHVAPTVRVGIDHVGVRLQFQPPRHLLFGEDLGRLALIGFFAGIGAALLLPEILDQPYGLALGGFLCGSASALFGVILIRLGRALLRLLS